MDPKTIAFLAATAGHLKYGFGALLAVLLWIETFHEKRFRRSTRRLRAFWFKLKRSPLRRLTTKTVEWSFRTLFFGLLSLSEKAPYFLIFFLSSLLAATVAYTASQVLWMVFFAVGALGYILHDVVGLGKLAVDHNARMIAAAAKAQEQAKAVPEASAEERKEIENAAIEEFGVTGRSFIVSGLLGLMILVSLMVGFVAIIYLIIVAPSLPAQWAVLISAFLLPVYLIAATKALLVPVAVLSFRLSKKKVRAVEAEMENADIQDIFRPTQSKSPALLDFAAHTTLLTVIVAVLTASIPLTLLGISLGQLSSGAAPFPVTGRVIVVNMICDAVTMITTAVLLFMASQSKRLRTYPIYFAADLAIGTVLAVLALFFSVAWSANHISLYDCLLYFVGYSPSQGQFAFGPQFWVMHSTLIPTTFYLGALIVVWLANLFVEAAALVVKINVAARRNPLRVTAAFLAVWVVIFEGIERTLS